jgi:hypothetical protein
MSLVAASLLFNTLASVSLAAATLAALSRSAATLAAMSLAAASLLANTLEAASLAAASLAASLAAASLAATLLDATCLFACRRFNAKLRFIGLYFGSAGGDDLEGELADRLLHLNVHLPLLPSSLLESLEDISLYIAYKI